MFRHRGVVGRPNCHNRVPGELGGCIRNLNLGRHGRGKGYQCNVGTLTLQDVQIQLSIEISTIRQAISNGELTDKAATIRVTERLRVVMPDIF